MEPLGLLDFRRRVEVIPLAAPRYAAKLLYLTACRANELCGKGREEGGTLVGVTGADGKIRAKRVGVTAPLRPTRATVSIEEFRPTPAQAPIEVLRFTLGVLKRRKDGVSKVVALPLSEEYDPWVRQVATVLSRMDARDPILPFDRWHLSKWLREFGLRGSDLGLTGDEERVLNPLRHMRAQHLVVHYGFSTTDLAQYGGWSLARVLPSPAMESYLRLDWRQYFPKLLVPLPRPLEAAQAPANLSASP